MRKSTFSSTMLAALSAAFLAFPMQQASAGMGDDDAGTIVIKAGVPSPIRRFISECQTPEYYGVSGLGSHGKITTRQIKGKACNQDNFPITLVTYTPDPGFVGVDNIMLYAFNVRITMAIKVVK